MILLRTECWEQDFRNIAYPIYITRTVCYTLGESARDTLKEWQEKGYEDRINDEEYGIVSEKRQAELAKLNLNELLDALFFQSKMASTLQVFPENITQAMSDLEVLVIKVLENTSNGNDIRAIPSKELKEVYQGQQGLYVPSQYHFKKHGKDYTTDIKIDLKGVEEVGKFFFATDHPGHGSPIVYFDHNIIHNNAPRCANVYVIGEMKRIIMGRELEPNPSLRARQTRRFIWSPICANTRLAPINLQEHTQDYEGFCIVPVKYFSVDSAVLQEIMKERESNQ